MSKNTPKKNPGPFETIFDLNGDGRTDAAEAAFMLMMFDEMDKEEKRKKDARTSKDNIIDLDDLDIDGI